MASLNPLSRLDQLHSELSEKEIDNSWIEAFSAVIEQITSFPFTLPKFLEKTAESCADIFSLLLITLPRVQDQDLRLKIFEIFETSIHKLTLAENWLFRGGQPNEALRSLLFQLTTDAGLTPTPTGEGALSVLDYRYHPTLGHYEQKVGEIAESLEALAGFEADPSDFTALDALVEFGDVFYNMLKLSQDGNLNLSLPDILAGILENCDPDKRDELTELYFELCNIAIWKFWFRYIQSEGVKNPHAEALELANKWTSNTKNGSPIDFLQKNDEDCRILLRGVAIFSVKILEGVMRDLELDQQQQEKIWSYVISVENI